MALAPREPASARKPPPAPKPVTSPKAALAPWSRRQLRTRVAAIVAAGVLVVVLHFTGLLDVLQRRIFPPPVHWASDYSVVEHLRGQVIARGLTHDAPDCLLFIINGNDPPEAQHIRVMEKHNAACPGTPGELPRLFTLLVDRGAGSVQSDDGSPGRFHPLAQ